MKNVFRKSEGVPGLKVNAANSVSFDFAAIGAITAENTFMYSLSEAVKTFAEMGYSFEGPTAKERILWWHLNNLFGVVAREEGDFLESVSLRDERDKLFLAYVIDRVLTTGFAYIPDWCEHSYIGRQLSGNFKATSGRTPVSSFEDALSEAALQTKATHGLFVK